MKRRALFIGVDEYDDPQIRNLRFSRIDAHSLNELFADIGYDVKYLPNPTKAEVFAAVRERTSGLAAGDSFLFYFAGHGFTQGGHDLIFCRDDVYVDLRFDDAGLKFDKLRMRTESNGAAYDRVFILDACRSDFLTGTRGAATYARDLVAVKELVKDVPKTGSLAVLRSCSPYQYALEIESRQHGLFTCALLDVMRTARRDGTRLAFDESFGDAVARTMAGIAREANLTATQTPDFAKSAGCAAQVLLEGRIVPEGKDGPNDKDGDGIALYVSCPKCGKNNVLTDTFKCRVCGTNHLCLSHYDKKNRCCDDCAAKKMEPKPGDTQTITLPGGVPMTFCWCPATTSPDWKWISGGNDYFLMGSPEGELGRYDGEKRHPVKLTKGFWIAQTPVTQRQYMAVAGTNPTKCDKSPDNPVSDVSWTDCDTFCRQLAAKLGDGSRFALPTEAQWEYACRAGTTTALNNGKDLTTKDGTCPNLDEVAWYGNLEVSWFMKNIRWCKKTVKRKRCNAWNLYDMHGNVVEWCSDYFGSYGDGLQVDPTGAASGPGRICRGGCYGRAGACRSVYRNYHDPSSAFKDLGFRPVRILPNQS